jgi:hypothetical protein
MIDVNLLLSQLLAKGLIGQSNTSAPTSAVSAATQPPSNQETNKQLTAAAADQPNKNQPSNEAAQPSVLEV